MADLLERASRLIQSEGFTGAHSFIFLTRYAALQGDKAVRHLDAFACAEILSGVTGQDVPEQVKRLQILPVVQHAECENSSRAMGDAVMEALG